MITSEPIPFKAAIEAAQARQLLPTGAGTEELELLNPLIRERAWFSARVDNARYLDRIAQTVTDLVSPTRATADGRWGINKAEARLRLQEELARIGYDSEAQGVKPGSLQDWSSDARLNLVIETNADMQRGKGAYVQGRSRGALAAFPAQELYRREARNEKRDWVSRWRAAGGKLYGAGRMVALKTDPVWQGISRFGLPYPPYDFGSGMWVRPVSRRNAKEMGLEIPRLDELTSEAAAQEAPEQPEVSLPKNRSLATALLQAFANRVTLTQDGKIRLES